jgi:sterol desaturase/sphingolipid hydroxylase (fatty acid hydroxylase superfamily)
VVAHHSREVKTLGDAWRQFLRRRSPWAIGAVGLVVLVLRLALGDWTWRDAAAAAALAAIYPFGEWAIHVYLLHMRPFQLRGRRVQLPTARAHGAHHRQPNDLDMVLLEGREVLALLALAVPFTIAIGAGIVALAGGALPFGACVSAELMGAVLVFAYEWCHFLIHTAYRPRSRYYRGIWRNHRLHHFKNERYWHGITSNLSDRVLGTFPDQRDVQRSRTARSLHA